MSSENSFNNNFGRKNSRRSSEYPKAVNIYNKRLEYDDANALFSELGLEINEYDGEAKVSIEWEPNGYYQNVDSGSMSISVSTREGEVVKHFIPEEGKFSLDHALEKTGLQKT